MKLNEITKPGFYTCDLEGREIIYEVINNTNEEWLKENPNEILLIDEWTLSNIDEEGRKCYEIYSGNLISVPFAEDIDVDEITNTKYTMDFEGQSIQDRCNGTAMREDKPSRLEIALDKLKKIEKKCLNEQKKKVGIYDWRGQCVCTDNESAKFAKKILKIIEGK